MDFSSLRTMKIGTALILFGFDRHPIYSSAQPPARVSSGYARSCAQRAYRKRSPSVIRVLVIIYQERVRGNEGVTREAV